MEVETTIHIQNIHCESCVHAIQKSLSRLSPTPSSIDVSIGLQSVKVVHDSDLMLQTIQPALLDAGFDLVQFFDVEGGIEEYKPTLLSGKSGVHQQFCTRCRQQHLVFASPSAASAPQIPTEDGANRSGQYKLTLSIGGMTCASCTRAIMEAMAGIPGVDDVAVSLIDDSAICRLETKGLASLVRDTIEECGYEATIVSIELKRQSAPVGEVNSVRTVTLKVDGVSGPQDPKKVMSAIGSVGNGITIEKPLTTHTDATLTLSYIPKLPSFTIRDIVSAIESSNDPPYHVHVYHPPTLEECTRAVQARETRDLQFRFGFSLIAAIPTFIIGVVYMSLVKKKNPGKMYLMEPMWNGNASRLEWALFFISTPVMFYSASVFHRCTVKEIRALWRNNSSLLRRFTRFGSMNLLASSGASVAYFSSLALLILAATRPPGDTSSNTTYFDAVVFLTMFLLMGRYIDITSKSRTGDAITALSSLRPSEALLVVPDSFSPREKSMEGLEKGAGGENPTSMLPGTKIQKVPVDFLEIGDVICVPCGATPPADGTLVDGERSTFNESSLTGESQPVSKQSGDKVYVGTINHGRMVHIKVDAVGEGTMLENIVKVVREGQGRRAPIERVADVITSYFVPVITLLAIVTWLVWLILGFSGALPRHYLDVGVGSWTVWSLRFAIAVFVVACPCGIGLAAPTAFTVGLGVAAGNGILAQGGGEAFQEMSQLDVIVFDKTGTLTEDDVPRVSKSIYFAKGAWTEGIIKCVATELESASSHPLARAIQQLCSEKDGNVVASNHEEIPGRGMKADFQEFQCTAIIGNEKWIHDHGATLDDSLSEQLEKWKSEGNSVVLSAMCNDALPASERRFEIVAAFAVAYAIRPNAAEVITWFQKRGTDTWMITGDNAKTADAIALVVGIPPENVIAGVLPHEKSEKVQQLQQGIIGSRHHKTNRNVVAMVGDGINDGPALTVADVGVAIGSGSDVAISSASFILVSSDLPSLITLQDLSTRVINRVKFNFAWALMYNVLAIPVAAGVIYPARHARLDPAWASLAMALSSCSVIFSSLLLKTYKAPKST